MGISLHLSSPKDDFPSLAEIHTLAMVLEMNISQTDQVDEQIYRQPFWIDYDHAIRKDHLDLTNP